MSEKKTNAVEELLEEALVPEEEQPYHVPRNWHWVKIKSLIKTMTSRDPKKLDSDTFNYIDIESIDNETQTLSKKKKLPLSEAPSRAKRAVNKSDVIISLVRPYLVNVALIEEDNELNIASTGFYVCRNKGGYVPKYLFNYLRSPDATIYLNLHTKGDNSPSVKGSDFKNIPVPLPPLHEQKRIADKVEHLLNKVDEAKQLIEEAKETFELRRSAILEKAFSGELTSSWRYENLEVESADNLYRRIRSSSNRKKKSKEEQELLSQAELQKIPATWIWVRLGDILEVNPPKEKLTDVNDEQQCSFIPMVSVSDATGEATSIETRPYEKVKKGYTYFRERDVIFAKITPCMENGKSAVLKGLRNGFGYGSTEFYVLRTNDYVNEKLIHLLVRSRKFRSEAKAVMTGAVGQQRVPKDFMKNYLFPLPPLEEQNEIVRIVESIFEKQEISNRLLETDKLEHLKQSLLSKAFKGELGTNDPSEESAEKLLKEVLQQQ
ncbi:restriction endonuclease subunit S [Salicibibacter cibarius]|uniref:Restriction endonuclease subunit S n=1 Tax=Salicibibacter cibarius TaxID=2743000 RepID=A0A7T6Z4R1_9BACI|nr:restriction endonuclease subunit S [Salicibibacter cibarius]QQK76870.1 restriction endonuclease subunit S [Salicibibacter cibarius]